MNVEGIDMIGVTYPFAFIVNKGQDLGTVVFSLKGVTYDSKAAYKSCYITGNCKCDKLFIYSNTSNFGIEWT